MVMRPISRTHAPFFLSVFAALGLLAAGYAAGRRMTPALLDRLRGRGGPAPLAVWERLPDAPFKVFETAVAVVGQRVFVFGGFHNAAIQASSAVWMYDADAKRWTRKGDMPSPFTHANAALLGGRVWFVGGFVGDNPGKATDRVWQYDPESDRWSEGPRLPAPRASGALVALGRSLHYFGGYLPDRDSNSPDHWMLDLPASGADSAHWRSLAPLPRPRGHLSGAEVGGLLYAIGGCDHHDPSPLDVPWVHRYDPATDRWTEVAPLPTPRSHFEPSTMVRGGRIVIVAGRSRPTGRESVDEVTEYDPGRDRWTALPPLPAGRHSPFAVTIGGRILTGLGGSIGSDPDVATLWMEREPAPWAPVAQPPDSMGEVASAVLGERLYLLGDASEATLALELGTGRWDPRAQHAVRPAPGNHHAAEVWQGKLYLFGGLGAGMGKVQIYDPATDRWRFGPDMPWAGGSVATALIGSLVYVAGGITRHGTTTEAARFDPATETWTPLPPMPRGRNHAAAATDGKRFFIFGGRGPGSGDHNMTTNGFDDTQIFDPGSNTWIASDSTPGAPARLPQRRGGMGKAIYDGREFWIFGGETADDPGATRLGVFDRVDVYDPVANRWRAGPPLPTARHGIFPVLVGDRVYVIAGGTRASISASRIGEALDLRMASAASPR